MSKQIVLKINKEYLKAIPRPTKEEYRTLKDSIYLEGQQDPIVINSDGVILDGHTRMDICRDLNLEVIYRIKNFETKEDEELYVKASNMNRRQLNPFQKIEIYYETYKQFKKEGEDNHKNSNVTLTKKYPKGGSLMRYATLIGVGEKRTFAGIKLLENADKKTLNQLRKGDTTINMAYTQLTKIKKVTKYKKRDSKQTLPTTLQLLHFFKKDVIKRDQIKQYIKEFWIGNESN